MTHKDRLLTELDRIIKHTNGNISIQVRPQGEHKLKVIISAGKNWVFIIDRYEEED